MSRTIGIDLGTTNSCVSMLTAGTPTVIPNLQGNRITPSVVAINNLGELLVGDVAKRQAVANPKNTICSIKRKMGTSEIFKIGGKEYLPQEVSAEILKYLKKSAEDFSGELISDAIITVPAYFTDAQRQATKEAGLKAGLNVSRIINEPTAAALAYGLNETEVGLIAVYDLGGGTFDISILRLADGVFEVIATSGDNALGGDDFDLLLANYVSEKFKEENGVDLMSDIMSSVRLMEACELAKIELSASTSTTINIPYITTTSTGPLHLNIVVTRNEFEKLINPLITKTMDLLVKTADDAGLEFKDLNRILLVGGSTRIPMISFAINKITDVQPSKNINPDECVSIGAAIQGAIITGEIKDLLLLDVTPLSLGVEVQGGLFSRIIDKNTTIPYMGHKIFSTAIDNQKEVEIKVYQGERDLAKSNKLLGNFILPDIAPAPRGVPQIDVLFDIDINGIVNISATDVQTGNKTSIILENQQHISDEEVKKAMEDAAINAKKDNNVKQQIEVINKANSMIDYANKILMEHKETISSENIDTVRTMIKELLTNISEGNIHSIEINTRELSDTVSSYIVSKTPAADKRTITFTRKNKTPKK